jgi:creatinine amidohydrolase
MPQSARWHLMTWQAIREFARRKPVVLVPAGTVETQGPFLWVGVEFVLPERLANDVAARTDAIVAPTIPFGWSPDFEDYPGTISLRPAVLEALYDDVARSILRHGFDKVLFLVTHIPNQPPIEQMAYRLRRELGVRIGWMNPGQMAVDIMKDLDPDYPAGYGHGADPSLSIAAYLEPEETPLDQARPSRGADTFKGLPFNLPLLLQDASPLDGGIGDPSRASVARGQRFYEELVTRVTEAVDRFRDLAAPAAERPVDEQQEGGT